MNLLLLMLVTLWCAGCQTQPEGPLPNEATSPHRFFLTLDAMKTDAGYRVQGRRVKVGDEPPTYAVFDCTKTGSGYRLTYLPDAPPRPPQKRADILTIQTSPQSDLGRFEVDSDAIRYRKRESKDVSLEVRHGLGNIMSAGWDYNRHVIFLAGTPARRVETVREGSLFAGDFGSSSFHYEGTKSLTLRAFDEFTLQPVGPEIIIRNAAAAFTRVPTSSGSNGVYFATGKNVPIVFVQLDWTQLFAFDVDEFITPKSPPSTLPAAPPQEARP